ncbi:MAG TPA: glycosyltransferase [Actinomycetota bacterium]|nr:glycosyltransferase [Actinomycetota bacterium]
MRVLLWHGWLLEGSGSNIYAARTAEVLREDGHDVLLVCQERHVERYRWIDASGTVDATGPSALTPNPAAVASDAGGRCVLLRPSIGEVLPVFVLDEYEGFTVRRFVDLDDATVAAYLAANVDALRAAVAWHDPEVAVSGHAIPGAVVAARALGGVPYVAKIHGSDLEYAIREQPRFAALAAEGLDAARAVVGASRDVLDRCAELVPGLGELGPVVAPGLDARTFRPRDRTEALLDVAERLRRDADVERGRPVGHDDEVRRALAARNPNGFDALAATYDQAVPEQGAADRLEALARSDRPIVGSFGKLIEQKGVHLLLEAARSTRVRADVLVVGFGSFREWLAALALVEDEETRRWIASVWPGSSLELAPAEAPPAAVAFTGRLDHRYAPDALAAMDVLVVPSILAEAFGMVAIEGVAAGALPLVARHSGLGEIAAALEAEIARPGLFSFGPGEGAAGRIARGLDALLGMDPAERQEVAGAITSFAGREWSWRATARRLLDAVR